MKALRGVLAILVISLSVVLVGVGVADAGLGAGATPTFPGVVTVGNTSVTASIELRNNNTTPNTSSTVCNAGDAFPCPADDPGITLIPSCGQLGRFSACTPAGADPDVFQISSTGVGAAGSACPGMTFFVTLIDPAFGQLRFTPQPLGAHVVLPTPGSVCIVNFTFDVVNAPTVDQNPVAPGLQTVQVVDFTQHDFGQITASARGTSDGTTVVKASPTIATQSAAIMVVGGQMVDLATVSGRVNSLPGATVEFRLYGPNDATCAGAPVFTSTVPYPEADGSVTSAAFTPMVVGVYRWVASYSGDANNNPVTGACNDANEVVTVSPASPSITTSASSTITVGNGQLADAATVSGLVNPQPGATITFSLYGPNDTICAAAPAFTSTVGYPVTGGAVISGSFTPSVAGDYRWVATYSGDANNVAVSGACNDANETVTVTPVPESASQAPVPSAAVPSAPVPAAVASTAVLPATGSNSRTLLYVAFGLTLTGCFMIGSTLSRRRRYGDAPPGHA